MAKPGARLSSSHGWNDAFNKRASMGCTNRCVDESSGNSLPFSLCIGGPRTSVPDFEKLMMLMVCPLKPVRPGARSRLGHPGRTGTAATRWTRGRGASSALTGAQELDEAPGLVVGDASYRGPRSCLFYGPHGFLSVGKEVVMLAGQLALAAVLFAGAAVYVKHRGTAGPPKSWPFRPDTHPGERRRGPA